MNLKEKEIEEKIRELANDGLLILGVGNILKGDDGFGSYFAMELKKDFPSIVFDCGVSPENYISKCINSDAKNVLIVDAVVFGKEAGELFLTSPLNLKRTSIPTTHGPTLQLVTEILLSTGKNVYILGVQPLKNELDTSLSKELSNTLKKLLIIFREALKGE
ncbi:MAG: hydrogenase maturation protease [bacterium]